MNDGDIAIIELASVFSRQKKRPCSIIMMKKFINIQALSLLILIYFSKSVLAGVPMLTMNHPAAPQTLEHTVASSDSHCLSRSAHHSSLRDSVMHSETSQHAASHMIDDSHCDTTCQCCVGSCSTLALLSGDQANHAIKSPKLKADFDLQLLPRHASSLFKPPIIG